MDDPVGSAFEKKTFGKSRKGSFEQGMLATASKANVGTPHHGDSHVGHFPKG